MLKYEDYVKAVKNLNNKYDYYGEFQLSNYFGEDDSEAFVIMYTDGCNNFRLYHSDLYEPNNIDDLTECIVSEIKDHLECVNQLLKIVTKQ